MLPKNKYPRHGKFTEDKSGNNSEVTKSKVTVNTIISKLNTEYININSIKNSGHLIDRYQPPYATAHPETLQIFHCRLHKL